MEDLKDVYLTPLPESPYVKPLRMNYTQNNVKKNWDLLEVHDSVAIIVFNISRNVLVLVKQFRPAIYYNSLKPADRNIDTIDTNKYPASLGLALEVCAGIVDKDKSIVEIACEEVMEECGYAVNPTHLQKVMSYRSGVGVQAALQTLYYVEVTDEMKTLEGGGVDGEIIEVVEKTIPEIEAMLRAPGPLNSPPSFLFAMMWFMCNKGKNFKK